MSAAISTDSPGAPDVVEPVVYEPGAVVAGKYELVRELGRGGMGVVWVAHNRVLDVHVAVKIIDLYRAPNPKRLAERVLREARASARLAHPAICRVFEFGETQVGDPFIVSELLHGETLGDVLKGQIRLSATRAVQVLLPIVEGLVLAHGRGVVHRDVKPENIFLSRDDVSKLRPKLLDFGVARMVDTDRKLTIDGTLLGTPDYMSPEQARGESDVDERTDVWSVCVVLYEAMAGCRPFEGNNYNALLWAVGHEEPRPLIDHDVGDEPLWGILKKGLEKSRDDRWRSMRHLGVALATWLLRSGIREDVCGFALESTWLADDGRVALSVAPPDRRGEAPGFATSRGSAGGPETGVFAKSSRRWARAVASMGRYWPLGVAAAAAAIAGLGLVLALSFRPRDSSLESQGEYQPAENATAPFPQRSLPPLHLGPSRAAPRPSVGASAMASASASAPIPLSPVYRSRRPARRKLDPETYDFGF